MADGALFKNTTKAGKQPDYRGDVTVDGKKWSLAAWVNDGKSGKYLSLRVSEFKARTKGESVGEAMEEL